VANLSAAVAPYPRAVGFFFGGKQRPQSVYVLDEMELHTRRVSIFSSPRYTRASGFNAPFTAQKLRGTPAPTYRLIVEDRCNLCDAPIPRQPPSPKGHPAPARRAENYRPLSKKSSSRSPPARTPCPRRAWGPRVREIQRSCSPPCQTTQDASCLCDAKLTQSRRHF